MEISVLVPIYNVEKFLKKCLQSLCEQVFPDMEILCINDGSNDSSKKIIESFCRKDSRFQIIDKINTGYGNSMNMGMDQAKGKYIAIIESDDFIEPDMMEKLYKTAELYELDVVKSSCYFYTDDGRMEENRYVDLFESLPMKEVFCPLDQSGIFLKMQSIWSAMYSRSFLVENHIRFNETPGASYQDVSFAFQVYACAKRLMLLPDAFYHYRVSNLNSSVKVPDKVFCVCDELDKIEDFIIKYGNNKERLRIIASRLGYRVLLEQYNNLADPYQYALFLKLTEYFKEYKDSGFIYETMWEKDAVKKVERILENPKKYFIETAKSFKDDRLMSEICMNRKVYVEAVIKQILSSPHVVIYGAGKIGTEFLGCLLESGYANEKISFAVTSMQGNERYISGIPVYLLESYQERKTEVTVVLAVKEQFQFSIAEILQKQGFSTVFSLDNIIRNYILRFGMVL